MKIKIPDELLKCPECGDTSWIGQGMLGPPGIRKWHLASCNNLEFPTPEYLKKVAEELRVA